MSPSPSAQTILITGANGFVASHIVHAFLSAGYNVRGTVRSASSIPAITSAHAAHASQLSFAIVPDITLPTAFTDAVKGVTGIIHTASPFSLSPKDTEADLLQPAIQGTLSVLSAAAAPDSTVKRVVLTSSFASILDLSQGYRPGYTYTSSDWNPISYAEAAASTGGVAYCASKKLAERAAWDFVAEHQPTFDLVSINPAWVFGPTLGPISSLSHLNESTAAIYQLLDAEKVPATDFAGFVDVRDLAAAHLAGFEKAEAGGKRFLVGSHFDYQSAVDAIREAFPELRSRVPEGTPGAGWKEEVYKVDGSEAESVLGVKYTPLKTTMRDTIEGLLEAEGRLGVKSA